MKLAGRLGHSSVEKGASSPYCSVSLRPYSQISWGLSSEATKKSGFEPSYSLSAASQASASAGSSIFEMRRNPVPESGRLTSGTCHFPA